MIKKLQHYNWPINYEIRREDMNPTKWSPYIYPTYTAAATTNKSGYIGQDELMEYERLNVAARSRFYYNWVVGQTVDTWV